jgi:hypothetical protein
MQEDARQDGVLENVGETAGMKGVAVIDLNCLPTAQPNGFGSLVQRSGATAIEPR